jgi:hypothetical protein
VILTANASALHQYRSKMETQLQELTLVLMDMKTMVVALREDLLVVKSAVKVLEAAASRSTTGSSSSVVQVPCPLGCPAHFKKVNYLVDHLHRAMGISHRTHQTISPCKLNMEDPVHRNLWTQGFKGTEAPNTAENVNHPSPHRPSPPPPFVPAQ